MKKFISIMLCICMIACTACSKTEENNEDLTVATSGLVSIEETHAKSNEYKIESEEGLRFRTGPGTENDVIATLDDGTVLEVEEIENGWAKVTYNGQQGYVSMDYLIKVETTIATSAATTENNTTKKSSQSSKVTTSQASVSTGNTDPNWQYGYALSAPQIAKTNSDWRLLLVNRDYKLPDSYIDSVQLSTILSDSSERLDSRVVPYYQEMFNAAAAEGIYLTPISGYRSYELQKNNFENLIAENQSYGYSLKDATIEASEVILPPGTSEHNAGLAMDIISLEETFENTVEFAWLQENAQDYGFILRYPKEKQNITKIIYEPWHWRYVGVETAKAMKRSGQCLEEYLGVA